MTQVTVTNGELSPEQERAVARSEQRARNIASRKRRMRRNNAIEKAHRSFYNYFNEHHATPESAQLLCKVIGELRNDIGKIG
jgi:hypothetical protein